MDFRLPDHLVTLLAELDQFIEDVIAPIQARDDNERFFDHRREDARTDWDRGGLPNEEWEALLGEMRRAADEAGFLRYHLPERFGGRGGSNFDMAVIREHLAAKGLGLFNDLQNESSIVGNFPTVLMMEKYGSEAQQEEWIPKMLAGKAGIAFGLTEPNHGSDATWMETRAVRDGDEWVINGEKMWNTGVHKATHDFVFARTSGEDGEAAGISCFIVPVANDGVQIEEYYWTFNMPTDHARVSFTNVRVRAEDVLGDRQRPAGGPAVRAREPHPPGRLVARRRPVLHRHGGEVREGPRVFGKSLSANQAIQFPLAELHTEAAMLRALIRQTAWEMDRVDHGMEISDKVAMCNYRGNRLVCEAADRAMQTCGGMGYSRHMAFEHIYRHHRRYRITEGAEEIQIRRVAAHLFGFTGAGRGSTAR
jgi:acyl-CoA dehydrogenase